MNKSTSPSQDWANLSHSMLPKQKSFDDLMTDQNKWDYTRLRGIARNTPMIVNARIVLKETIFKNRFEWLPAFASKCTICGFTSQVKIDFCPKCGGEVREPDAEEIIDAEEFFKSVNEYAESLIEVLESAEDEINITDSAWLLILKKYSLLPTGEQDHKIIDDYKVLAIEKLYPEYIFHNIDKQTGRHKQEWFCIQHRNEVESEEGYCKFCGVQLLPAYYFYKHEDNIIYYAKDELIWWHFYDTRGYSPIRAILKLVMTQWGLDDELFERYYHKVLPKSIIAVTTSNLTSLAKTQDYIIKKAKENEVPFVGIESSSGRGTIQKISLMDDSVTDLSNEPTRDLIRREINTVYGVVPLYSADTERASALSGEGQQLMVQDDRAKAKQAKYNEFVLPQILEALKIEDWILQLKTPRGDFEIQILEVESKKIQNAQGMLNMGFDVVLDDDNNFIFSGEAKQLDTIMESPFEMELEKARKYIKDPSQAPKGAKVQQGKRGGYYYDTEGVEGKPKPEKKPKTPKASMKSYQALLNKTPEGQEQLKRIEGFSLGDYKSYNEYLRTGKMKMRAPFGGGTRNATKKEKQKQEEKIEVVSEFLKNAPKYSETTYRGMRFEKDKKNQKIKKEFLDQMISGESISMPTFSSTTPDLDTAKDFSGEANRDKFDGVLLEFHGKTGVFLDGASAYEDENEVLFDRNSKYRVISVEDEPDIKRIILEEI